MRKYRKRSIQSEIYRLKMLREAVASPLVRKKTSEGIKRAYENDPTYAKRISETRKRKFLEQGFLNSPETRKKIGIAQLGRIPWNKKPRVTKSCLYCGELLGGRYRSNKKYFNIICANKNREMPSGKNHPNWKGGPVEKICIICKKEFMTTGSYRIKKYCSNFCYGEDLRRGIPKEILRKMLSCRKPNNDEAYLFSILEKNFPHEWNFVGDGKVIIEGKNPDFININGKKQIIELFGKRWHEESEIQPRMEIFAKYGYKTLILWDYELKNEEKLMEKINMISLTAEERP